MSITFDMNKIHKHFILYLLFSIFILVIYILFVSCTDRSNFLYHPQKSTTEFVILGDRTGGHIEGVFPLVLKQALETKPEFLIDVGDLIEGYTENHDTLTMEWNEYLNLISNVKIPYHHTPGNHDLWLPGQMEYYLHYIGAPYYSFNYNNIHFVFIDNSRWTPDSTFYLDGKQMLWLENDLNNNTQKYKILFCHRPFWDKSVVDSNIANSSFHSFLLSEGVDVVISGHYHNYFKTTYDNMTYVMAGRSGGASTVGHPYFTPKDIRYVAPTFEEHRFLTVTVDDSIHIESHIVPTN